MKKRNTTPKLSDWQVRVIAEKAELDSKIAALKERLRVSVLTNLVDESGFDDESTLELFVQLTTMKAYSGALQRRVERF